MIWEHFRFLALNIGGFMNLQARPYFEKLTRGSEPEPVIRVALLSGGRELWHSGSGNTSSTKREKNRQKNEDLQNSQITNCTRETKSGRVLIMIICPFFMDKLESFGPLPPEAGRQCRGAWIYVIAWQGNVGQQQTDGRAVLLVMI